jgi:hypothetical protein
MAIASRRRLTVALSATCFLTATGAVVAAFAGRCPPIA